MKQLYEEIKRWDNGLVIHSGEFETTKGCLLDAIKENKDLRYSDLRGSNLRGSNLRGSNLRGSDLRGSDLSYSDLSYSDLRGSDLSYSDLSYSDLRGSNLRGSNLRGSNLSDSNLDFSCMPLHCGDLKGGYDDKQIIQQLYYVLSHAMHSENCSKTLKKKLLTKGNVNIANKFHRVLECGEISID